MNDTGWIYIDGKKHLLLYEIRNRFVWIDLVGKKQKPTHATLEDALEHAEASGWKKHQGQRARPPPTQRRRDWTAEDVLAAARQQRGAFGGDSPKVYVSDVIQALPGLTKQALIGMHQRGEIELTRLDLTKAAHDAGERRQLEESEIRHLNATYHFISPPPNRSVLDAVQRILK